MSYHLEKEIAKEIGVLHCPREPGQNYQILNTGLTKLFLKLIGKKYQQHC